MQIVNEEALPLEVSEESVRSGLARRKTPHPTFCGMVDLIQVHSDV